MRIASPSYLRPCVAWADRATSGPLARPMAAGLAFLVGTGLQLQQPALWEARLYGLLLAAGIAVLGLLALPRWPRSAASCVALALAVGLLGFAATALRAGWRLADALPAALEGRDIVVAGRVDGLPQRSAQALRFYFEVESARLDGVAVGLPQRLSVGWYAQGAQALPEVRAGQRWQLVLRLKRPHGAMNPHGHDFELWLFEQGVRATGYVRALPGSDNRLLEPHASASVDGLRQRVREAIERHVPDPTSAGVLAALAVGDQAAIEREDWALFRDTGVAHLMSISGLHVTMFAWLAGVGVGWAWRASRRALRWCPAPHAALWGGLVAALAYAVFAGWGVPAQRTVLMLAVATAIKLSGLRWPWPLVWGSAAVVVAALDPWALLQPGFWLSFVAVGLLLASGEARGSGLGAGPASRGAGQGPEDEPEPAANGAAEPHGPRAPAGPAPVALARAGGRALRALREALRTQAIATFGLAPLTLVFFQQLSLVGFAANLVAIPLVTLLITPLALLGALLPPLWTAAAWAIEALCGVLRWLAAPAWAVWSIPAAAPWAVAAALAGGALALLPLPWRVRLLGLPLLLPLLLPLPKRPAPGEFELTAVDVGQGNAVLLRTAGHTLLYDAGPQYSREADAGERVLLPLLRALGETRLDMLVLSHRDTDHVGGAAALLRGLPVAQLRSSLEPGHALLALAGERGAERVVCAAGQRWEWDGVSFLLLHPGEAELEYAQRADSRQRPNTVSCVLQASGRIGGMRRSVLLTGDLEREQEARLVARHGDALASEVLLVPHHGSKTSSSAVFLDAVAPRVALVQAGYRNRFGHPAAEVLGRYEARGIGVVDSARCGAWRFGAEGASCWRQQARRYWHHTGRPGEPGPAADGSGAGRHNGLEVAYPVPVPAAVFDAVDANE